MVWIRSSAAHRYSDGSRTDAGMNAHSLALLLNTFTCHSHTPVCSIPFRGVRATAGAVCVYPHRGGER
ncbi:hypothetical protein DMB66_41605 [Actinoplanes sp. ATCC 53533]|uniref:hypothetical protein n=1 Tax=Actinoplanes sp. ATCC 53533 TaxID=1288362 RepID=UPI000F776C73|nr:hypothetical protein [Actinoplanes sp. ATCC 53533]RSM51570.1 hypothetical protein DMB66_41605 [Actinoplanes sp. ATCC 53533]